jgi:hypothetical protein
VRILLLFAVFVIIFFCILPVSAQENKDSPDQDFSKGPLYGKNLYIPFLIHYNFPSLPAKSGERFDLQSHFSVYFTQDARYRGDLPLPESNKNRNYDKAYVVRDYEGFTLEMGAAYNFLDKLQTGVDIRLFSFYGGILDSFIEGFHNAFGFSNGTREIYSQNRIYINIPNDKGSPLFLDKYAVSFGDIDLWCKWTFLENRYLSLAALGAFKLPTGKFESLSGSGYPDAAAGLLLDFKAAHFISLYSQAGIVLPFTDEYYPMFNGLLGVEVHPWKTVSFNLQMNIKTSPLSDKTIPFGWNDDWHTDLYQFTLPQTNLLAGVVIQLNRLRFQVYFEEDFLFNQGCDFTLGIISSYTMNLKDRKNRNK